MNSIREMLDEYNNRKQQEQDLLIANVAPGLERTAEKVKAAGHQAEAKRSLEDNAPSLSLSVTIGESRILPPSCLRFVLIPGRQCLRVSRQVWDGTAKDHESQKSWQLDDISPSRVQKEIESFIREVLKVN